MHPNLTLPLLTAVLSLSLSSTSFAGPRDELLAQYASAAKAADPAFAGFSAVRGKALYLQTFTGGKPDTPSCTRCHGKDTRAPGQTLTGKSIEPVALSASPTRYADPAKVEKWFKRNCTEVMGRECSPREKGDWLSFMAGQ
jgi:mono/diheme cytochrome c family protein